MKIHIHTAGDSSVGVFPDQATVEIEGIDQPEEWDGGYPGDTRKNMRESLEQAFLDIFGEKPTIMFQDEIDKMEKDLEGQFNGAARS